MKIHLKTPISYYGGKQLMLGDIIPMIPEHNLYCEPFCGGAAVFWAKEPSNVEVINDINTEVINFYNVLQTRFDELYVYVNATLHSRKSYDDAKVVIENPHLFDDVMRAWALWVCTSQSFASIIGGGWAYARKENTCEKKVYNQKERFKEVYKNRLKTVQIECTDAIKVIKSRDTLDSFFYVDPPYPGTDQGHYSGYRQEDFDNLLNVLKTIKGKFLLSSFPNISLDVYIKENRWNKKEVIKQRCASKEKKGQKTEVLIWNY